MKVLSFQVFYRVFLSLQLTWGTTMREESFYHMRTVKARSACASGLDQIALTLRPPNSLTSLPLSSPEDFIVYTVYCLTSSAYAFRLSHIYNLNKSYKNARTAVAHVWFIALIFAGSLGRYLNTRPAGLCSNKLLREQVNINAWINVWSLLYSTSIYRYADTGESVTNWT